MSEPLWFQRNMILSVRTLVVSAEYDIIQMIGQFLKTIIGLNVVVVFDVFLKKKNFVCLRERAPLLGSTQFSGWL